MKTRLCLAFAALLSASSALLAQGPTPSPAAPPADIGGRLNQLEAETQSLRAEVQWMRDHPVRLPAVEAMPIAMTAPAPTPQAEPLPSATAPQGNPQQQFFTMDELHGEVKKFAWKKGDFSIVPYGILWGNTVYSTERTSPGSYTLFVQSASTGPESECIVDARNTRLGIDVGGPQIAFLNGAQTGGKVEIDFQNNTLNLLSGENKSTVMLRHAYFDVKNEDYRFLVGQTWDVISPLYPGMLMYSVGWEGGNIGFRRAQFRGERYLTLSDVSLVTAQFAIAPQVFVDNATSTVAGAITGEPSNWPLVEGRVAWTIGQRGQGCYPITVGLSGHIGEQEFDTTLMGRHNRRRTWSGNIDVRVPITERIGVQGECQIGENLGAFLGGIGQGIDPIGLTPIRDAGGWLEVWYDWTPTLHSHVGYSVDDPNNHDLHLTGEKSYNQFYFGNLVYDVTRTFLVGVEVSSWKTVYVGQLPGDSVRCEFVAKYAF